MGNPAEVLILVDWWSEPDTWSPTSQVIRPTKST
jgi:hypothetical protein